MSDDAWQHLARALNSAAGRNALPQLWWRDDDAARATEPLNHLLELRERLGMPLALAAIPEQVDDSLVARLMGERDVALLVHGLSHSDHALPGEKKAEFGRSRPLSLAENDARQGLQLLSAKAGARALPVFVPPWNRLSADLRARLPALGYRGLSSIPAPHPPPPGLAICDIHVDPIDWHGTRSALPAETIVARTLHWLERFERGEASGSLGFLTHHLVHDGAIWSATERWLTVWRDAGADCPEPRALFGLSKG